MQFFDGNLEAKKLDKIILEKVEKNGSKNLAIIKIGKNDSSEKYVNLKKRVGEKLGIGIEVFEFSENLSDLELESKCTEVYEDSKYNGVIVQLPLPRTSLSKILDTIPRNKDVDLLSSESKQNYYNGDLQRTSPVVKSVEYFVDSINLQGIGQKAIVLGSGDLVGKPVTFYLKNRGFEVEILENYSRGTRLSANLIVSATGVPNLVSGVDILEGANFIDFGSAVENGKTVGDLDLNSPFEHLNVISTSPGGMGPLTVRFLFSNLFEI